MADSLGRSHFVNAASERKSGKKQPSADEASVLDRAIEVIGDKHEAMRWMGTAVRALDYPTPVSLLGNSKGRRAVLTVLGRLEHGVL
jgi:putative toxin-antitoxin system antitoxin component (TIGR02293 family)